MKGLRREGENKKTFESKAAATGAKLTLGAGLFKLCDVIFPEFLAFFIFRAKNCINFYLCK